MGRLTADPELRQTPNGTSVATFSLAIQRTMQKDVTDFITIVTWRQTADFVNRHFSKGQLVAVEGSLQSRNYTDKTGNKRTVVEVVAEQVYFADSKPSESHAGSSVPASEAGEYEEEEYPSFFPTGRW